MPALSNEKHERYCHEFLSDCNSTAAYRRTYPDASPKSAEAGASRLLRNVKVAARIAELQAERSARVQVTTDDVLRELMRVGFSDLRRVTKWGPDGVTLVASGELADDDARCIGEVCQTTSETGGSLRVKLHDKLAALTLLGKHLGLFVDRVEHSGSLAPAGPLTVTFHVVPNRERSRPDGLPEAG